MVEIDRRNLLKGLAAVGMSGAISQKLGLLFTQSAIAGETPELDVDSLAKKFKDPTYLQKLETDCTLQDLKTMLLNMVRASKTEAVTAFVPAVEEGLHTGSMTLTYGGSYGNATRLKVRIKSHLYTIEVTAGHVVADGKTGRLKEAALKSGWKTRYPSGPDRAVRLVTEETDQPGLPFSFSHENVDIGGEIGSILGTDVDRSATGMTPRQRKYYNGIISPKFSERMLQVLGFSGEDLTYLKGQRAMIIPISEAETTTFGDVPAQGMSGTAVLVRPANARGVHFGGAFSAVSQLKIGDQLYGVGFFFDQEEFAKTMRELIPELTAQDVDSILAFASRK